MIEVEAEAVPIAKLPGELDPRAKFDGIAKVLSIALGVIAGGKAGSKENVIEEEKIEIDSQISIKRSLRRCHEADEWTKMQKSIGRLQAFEMELIFDFEFKGSMSFSVQIKSANSK